MSGYLEFDVHVEAPKATGEHHFVVRYGQEVRECDARIDVDGLEKLRDELIDLIGSRRRHAGSSGTGPQLDKGVLSALPEVVAGESDSAVREMLPEHDASATALPAQCLAVANHASAIGNALYKAFPPPLWDAYAKLQALGQAREQGVRMRLDIEDPRMAALPWEYLSNENGFIIRSTKTPIVRGSAHAMALKPLSDAVLRVLVVVANPDDAPVPGVEQELRWIRHVLADQDRVRLDFLHDPDEGAPEGRRASLDNLQAYLRQAANAGEPYHVLHFIGHGRFDRGTGKGYLLFEDEHGASHSVSDEQIEWLVGDHDLRLVFLNACQGARTADTDAFSGIAADLLRRGIPAVIAMQFEITGEAAAAFAREFYEASFQGSSIDAAVAEGRKAIRSIDEDTIEWGTPVLFTRYIDGQPIAISAGIGPLIEAPPEAPISSWSSPTGDPMPGSGDEEYGGGSSSMHALVILGGLILLVIIAATILVTGLTSPGW